MVTLIEASREHRLDSRGLTDLLKLLERSNDRDAVSVASKIRRASWDAGATVQVVLSRDERLQLCRALDAAEETTPALRILQARLCWTTFPVGPQRVRVPRLAADRLATALHDGPALGELGAAIDRAADVVPIDRDARAPFLDIISAAGLEAGLAELARELAR